MFLDIQSSVGRIPFQEGEDTVRDSTCIVSVPFFDVFRAEILWK